jgi:outer membrane protein OmpA-like peptidoglycan-associated protein
VLAGCATPSAVKEPVNDAAAEGRQWFRNPYLCAAGGALVAGGLASTENKESALIGAVIGGSVGYLACNWEEKGPPDADGDGIPDKVDLCADTPKGTRVSTTGCPLDHDTDGDGVPDTADKCAATGKGVDVDATGCPVRIDADGDGVTDSRDMCPNTPPGAKVLDNGCEEDTDKDGVPDSSDRCQGTPSGVKVGPDGCAIDSDGDGVPDVLDRCPNTPAGAKVDSGGCEPRAATPPPAKPAAAAPVAAVTRLEGVNFETSSAKISRDSFPALDKVAEQLKGNSGLRVEVAGHTDAQGSAVMNRALSQRRAEMVMSYLVAKGVPAASLVAKGYGPDQPLADNDSAEGRAKNRRVELRVLGGN